MKKSKQRLVVDIIMVVLLVIEMFYLLTGNVIHEVLGVAFFATVGVHLYLTHKMGKALLEPDKQGAAATVRRMKVAKLTLVILLALDGMLLLVSSLLVSNLIYDAGVDLVGGYYDLWAAVHVVTAYVLCALVAIHGALHWAGVLKAAKIPYDPRRRQAINNVAVGCASLGAVALLVAAGNPLNEQIRAFASNEESEGEGRSQAGSPSSNVRGGQRSSTSESPRYFELEEELDGSSDSSTRKGRGPGSSSGSGNSGSQSDSSSRSGSSQRGSQSDGTQGGTGSQWGPQSGGSQSGSGSQSGGSQSGSASGICTLCRKRCSLSNPKCNKPYAAGLI